MNRVLAALVDWALNNRIMTLILGLALALAGTWAMLGLPVDVPARHPICKQLFEIAGQLRSQFSGDIAVFRTALEQVEQLIAERNASIAKNAEPYIEMLQQFDARDQAAFESRLALDKLTVGLVPGPVREFLDDTWQKVLQLVWTESGPESSQWQAHKDVIHDLLWTFQPKAVAEDRKALAKRLPEILKLLKSGMDRVGMPAEAQAAFLDVSFALQTQALRTSASRGSLADAVVTGRPPVANAGPAAHATGGSSPSLPSIPSRARWWPRPALRARAG